MALSQSQKKPEDTASIAIVSVGHFNEAYPNTYYKVRLLQDHYQERAISLIYPLGTDATTSGLRNLKIAVMLRYLFNNLRAFWKLLRSKPQTVYICYPGVVLAFLCSFIPGKKRPKLFIDAFISLYDTIVLDRKLVEQSSPLAKLLFCLERRAYRTCEKIIVDTEINMQYTARLFDLAPEQCEYINLTIPPLKTSIPFEASTQTSTCLFIGTFVPLQGIATIAEAARLLKARSDIRFRIIGDGQDGELLANLISKHQLENISWERAWQPTEVLQQEIAAATLCLGIFGDSDKADRVWPFKNYLYMASGKAIITGNTSCAQAIQQNYPESIFQTSTPSSGETLAAVIEQVLDADNMTETLAGNALKYFENKLSHSNALKKLTQTLDSVPT